MFNEHHFPYEYECESCGRAAKVTHEDVQDAPSYLANSGASEAVEYVMVKRRGWSLQSQGALCPSCVDLAY